MSEDASRNPAEPLHRDSSSSVEVVSANAWNYKKDGLYVAIKPLRMFAPRLYEGLELPSDALVGKMDVYIFPTRRGDTASLLQYRTMGLQALQGFFEEIDKGHPRPQYLVGITTSPIARAAQRLGCRTIPMENDGHFFRIVGETAIIRDRVNTILAKTEAQGRKRGRQPRKK